jgi:hypothetical protein
VLFTKAFPWPESGQVHLNADASRGEVNVAACYPDQTVMPGYGDQPVRGDRCDAVVSWSPEANASSGKRFSHATGVEVAGPCAAAQLAVAPGTKVKFRIRARDAKLYSFWT